MVKNLQKNQHYQYICVNLKRRYQQQDERFVQLVFRAYLFYKATMPQTQKDRTYDDFLKANTIQHSKVW